PSYTATHPRTNPLRVEKSENIFGPMEISVEIGPVCGEVVSGVRPNPLDFNNFHTSQAARLIDVIVACGIAEDYNGTVCLWFYLTY
ncbi:MAG TPA: hypothetical protein VLI39_10185, partial [Sedimentisphaerales bacterium]|nr:hypothetical protein [Sedimentisphaerales bacterium]